MKFSHSGKRDAPSGMLTALREHGHSPSSVPGMLTPSREHGTRRTRLTLHDSYLQYQYCLPLRVLSGEALLMDWRIRSGRRPIIDEPGHAHELTF